MSLNFSRIPSLTAELAALECLKNQSIFLLAPSVLIGSSSLLQVIRTTIKPRMSSHFDQIGLLTAELAALESLEKSLCTYNGRNIVTTLVPSVLNGSSLFLQVTSTDIKLG